MLSDIGQKAEIQEIVLKLDKLHMMGWYLMFPEFQFVVKLIQYKFWFLSNPVLHQHQE